MWGANVRIPWPSRGPSPTEPTYCQSPEIIGSILAAFDQPRYTVTLLGTPCRMFTRAKNPYPRSQSCVIYWTWEEVPAANEPNRWSPCQHSTFRDERGRCFVHLEGGLQATRAAALQAALYGSVLQQKIRCAERTDAAPPPAVRFLPVTYASSARTRWESSLRGVRTRR